MRALLGFWPTAASEGIYGALDYLAHHYLGDWYVPHLRLFCRRPCGSYGHDR